jgi:hypothetical protein
MRTDGRGIRAITDHLRVDLHRHYAASYAAAVIFSRASGLLSTLVDREERRAHIGCYGCSVWPQGAFLPWDRATPVAERRPCRLLRSRSRVLCAPSGHDSISKGLQCPKAPEVRSAPPT